MEMYSKEERKMIIDYVLQSEKIGGEMDIDDFLKKIENEEEKN